MSHNTFGHLFRFTTWGESHGPAIGCVVDGAPPLIELAEPDIQTYLDKRRPGTSRFVTQRNEPDQVKILSGVFEGQTTGTPISLLIENKDQRSKDYSEIKTRYRPGHADLTYDAKYGIRDYRGGGRSSARETANRVAAGAIARKILGDIDIKGAVIQIGEKKVDGNNWDWAEVTITLSGAQMRRRQKTGKIILIAFANLEIPLALQSKSAPQMSQQDGARPFTESSIAISPWG